jgi:uncharacterized membrane protein
MNLILVLALVFPALFTRTSLSWAHEESTASSGPKQSEAAASPQKDEEGEEDKVDSGAPLPVPIPFSGNLKKHLHNRIIHFPLALGMVGSLFVLIALKKPEMMMGARILWLIGAVVGIAAYFTGTWQERPFEHGTMHNIFEIHENLGIVSIISLWAGFFLTFIKRLKNLTVLVAIEIAVVVAITGYYGGVLAH